MWQPRQAKSQRGIAPTVAAADDTTLPPFPAVFEADAVLAFDNFEDGDMIANTGVRWQTFTNGVSSADLELVDAGAEGTAKAARVTGALTMGAARGPLAQMYLPFDRGAVAADLQSLGSLSFYARGSSSLDVSFLCGEGGSGAEVELSEEWQLVELDVDDLACLVDEGP